ncbi:HAD family hydrolase [Curtobacterium sp. Leaf261]|uniref:HAD family hydrolase n=1 Tax=Curtobacterium sp. Leaf261 TaxID=1736311 RepID=UPI0012E2C68B|nr:HAD hydrolase family protein [Curtobacterium sp. Leaf261]
MTRTPATRSPWRRQHSAPWLWQGGGVPTMYVTDLDGTLLAPTGDVSPFTADAVATLQRAGVLITCATARSWLSTSRILGDLRFGVPVVLYNGILTYDAVDGTTLDRHALPDDVVRAAIEVCRAQGCPPLVFRVDDDGQERVSWVRAARNAGVESFWDDRPADPRNDPLGDWGDLPTSGVFIVQCIGGSGEMQALAASIRAVVGDRAVVNAHPDTYHPEEIWLEVAPAGTSKAVAVRALADRLGADRIVVFGDNLNDLPMFAIADEAYAVGNAVAEVRRAATAVIASNADDGVARWLLANAVRPVSDAGGPSDLGVPS